MREYEKSCIKCQTRFDKRKLVCERCGGALLTVDLSAAQVRSRLRRRRITIAAGMFVAFMVFVSLIVLWNFSETSKAKSGEQQLSSTSSTEAQPSEPTQPDLEPQGPATVSITPWQFIKNPFTYRGKPVRLDYFKTPFIYNGSPIRYSRCNDLPRNCEILGLIGLRFNRMFAANQALYDVMASDIDSHGNGEKQGELLVDVSQGTELALDGRDWIVVPEDATEGTNGYGATVSVPTVRFVRLANDTDAPRVGDPQRVERR